METTFGFFCACCFECPPTSSPNCDDICDYSVTHSVDLGGARTDAECSQAMAGKIIRFGSSSPPDACLYRIGFCSGINFFYGGCICESILEGCCNPLQPCCCPQGSLTYSTGPGPTCRDLLPPPYYRIVQDDVVFTRTSTIPPDPEPIQTIYRWCAYKTDCEGQPL